MKRSEILKFIVRKVAQVLKNEALRRIEKDYQKIRKINML